MQGVCTIKVKGDFRGLEVNYYQGHCELEVSQTPCVVTTEKGEIHYHTSAISLSAVSHFGKVISSIPLVDQDKAKVVLKSNQGNIYVSNEKTQYNRH